MNWSKSEIMFLVKFDSQLSAVYNNSEYPLTWPLTTLDSDITDVMEPSMRK